MTEHRELIRDELEQIRQKHGGLLKPEDVVAFARNKRTALHQEFEWDDERASAEYRLEQARKVIRVAVTILPSPHSDQEPVRAYVSVASDRAQPGGGYRAFADVMTDDAMRAERLARPSGGVGSTSGSASWLRSSGPSTRSRPSGSRRSHDRGRRGRAGQGRARQGMAG